jgi:hypothetical protein
LVPKLRDRQFCQLQAPEGIATAAAASPVEPELPADGGLQASATRSNEQSERPQTADVADAHAAPRAGADSGAGQQEPEPASRAAAEDAALPQLSPQPMQPADAPQAAASWGVAAAEDMHPAATEGSPGVGVAAAVPPAADVTEQLSAGQESPRTVVRSSDDGGGSMASETDSVAQDVGAAPQQPQQVAPADPGSDADILLSTRGEDRPSGPADLGDTPSSESRAANSCAPSSGG